MTFRWYGSKNDNITLNQINQIPGVEGIVWSLHDIPVGEEWPQKDIFETTQEIKEYGFNIDVVESVNVHEDIKLGLPTRDYYIENYKRTIENLAQAGVKVICYNFMPVFDWVRTELNYNLGDGSNAMFFQVSEINNITPEKLVK